MSKHSYFMTIILLIIGIIGTFIYFNNQISNLKIAFQQKDVMDLFLEQDLGISFGKITLVSGNCMPIACDNLSCASDCLIEGVSKKIYIRKIPNSDNINLSDLKQEEKQKLIKTIISNSDGSYILILPIGKYSLFVEDNGKEYCNLFDIQGNACMFEIKKGQITQYDSQIDHATW